MGEIANGVSMGMLAGFALSAKNNFESTEVYTLLGGLLGGLIVQGLGRMSQSSDAMSMTMEKDIAIIITPAPGFIGVAACMHF